MYSGHLEPFTSYKLPQVREHHNPGAKTRVGSQEGEYELSFLITIVYLHEIQVKFNNVVLLNLFIYRIISSCLSSIQTFLFHPITREEHPYLYLYFSQISDYIYDNVFKILFSAISAHGKNCLAKVKER